MIEFGNSYMGLGEKFFARVRPVAVRAPKLVKVNGGLARELGVDAEWLASDAGGGGAGGE